MTSDNLEQLPDSKQDEITPEITPECGAGCSCNKSNLSTKMKVIVLVVIAFAVTGILLNGFLNKAGAQTNQNQTAFASSIPMSGSTETASTNSEANASEKSQNQSVPVIQPGVTKPIAVGEEVTNKELTESALWGEPLTSLKTLNTVAMDKGGVFVFLPGTNQTQTDAIRTVIEKTAGKAKSRGTVMGAYILNNTSQEYLQISSKSPAPCVLVMVKKAGASLVSGEITEEKLLQALVTASRPPSACCPSSGPTKPGTVCK
jgi:hypothetical protein